MDLVKHKHQMVTVDGVRICTACQRAGKNARGRCPGRPMPTTYRNIPQAAGSTQPAPALTLTTLESPSTQHSPLGPRMECQFTEWCTPPWLVTCVTKLLGVIECDPASNDSNNTQAKLHYTPKEDGLAQPWRDGTYVNPPYGTQIKYWAQKLSEEASFKNRIVALLPVGARFATKYYQRHVLNQHLTAMVIFPRRVKFLDPRTNTVPIKGPMHDSILYAYNIPPRLVDAAFRHHGRVLSVEVRNPLE